MISSREQEKLGRVLGPRGGRELVALTKDIRLMTARVDHRGWLTKEREMPDGVASIANQSVSRYKMNGVFGPGNRSMLTKVHCEVVFTVYESGGFFIYLSTPEDRGVSIISACLRSRQSLTANCSNELSRRHGSCLLR